ncbi:MAG TPA: RagB/SusD family nutrient uptake outer membrane protein [Prolixibacteraceae bacterium]|nr:RagB/SusD family nutrient uptake outer membrane protein [Prolixibacteraceae bacterium]
MRKLFYICAIAFIFINAISCKKDFLNVQPLNQLTDEAVWSDPVLIIDFVNNIYVGRGSEESFNSYMTDECMWGSNALFVNGTIGSTNIGDWGFDGPTSGVYGKIRNCNIFFQKIETANIDSTTKHQLKGEVYFMRAYYYHRLVSYFGGVPIVTKVYGLSEDFLVPRNTLEESINFVVADCDRAASLLATTPTEKGRATKGAALALKARMLLVAASDLFNSNGSWAGSYAHPELISYVGGDRKARWQAAKDAAKAVIDLGIYSLYKPNPASLDEAAKNYKDVFILKETSEDIMVRFISLTLGGWWGENNPGLISQPNGWHCWGAVNPTQKLVDAFQMTDGTKFDWSNPVEAANPFANRDPRFYASVLYDGAPWRPRPADVAVIDPLNQVQTSAKEVWNATKSKIDTVYGVDTRKSPIEAWNGGWTSYYMNKFMDPAFDAQYFRQDAPWRNIRYAEILLDYAECCLALGQEAEAKTYINMIRHRAGMPDIPSNETGAALVDRYRNERFVELAFEWNSRFIDIRRWMIGPSAYVNAQGLDIWHKLNPDHITTTPSYKVVTIQQRAWNNKYYLLPIGLSE